MEGSARNAETLTSHSSPTKRPKLERLTSRVPPSSKGKSPIEELKAESISDDDGDQSPNDDSEPQSCGICLSEEAAVRGCIDSCDHYFCFLCIIEWSKIESRCPMCKRRFGSIRRMRRDGSFISDRSVNVPVRDQIYHPLGNMSSGASDPYSDVNCSVCQGATDENLLLLCDLCDTAVHTYCIGLGATVPEGDWFCRDCLLVKAEQTNNEVDSDLGISCTAQNQDTIESIEAPVSVFDIVREPEQPKTRGVERLLRLVTSNSRQSSSAAVVFDRTRHGIHTENGRSAAALSSSMSDAMEPDARTLLRCRNVRKRIQVLRANWAAFQNGTLNFSSDTPSKANSNSMRMGTRSGAQPGSSTPTTSSQPKSQGSSSGGSQDRDLYNADRAWKMFDLAKSMAQARDSSRVLGGSPKVPADEMSISKISTNLKVGCHSSKSAAFAAKDIGAAGLKVHDSLRMPDEGGGFQGRGNEQNGKARLNGTMTYGSIESGALLSSMKSHPSVEASLCESKAGMPSKRAVKRVGSDVHNQQDGLACLASAAGQVARVSNIPAAMSHSKTFPSINMECKGDKGREDGNCSQNKSRKDTPKSEIQPLVNRGRHSPPAISHKKTFPLVKMESTDEKLGEDRNCGGSSSRQDDGRKSEIQSLVKLNLKILSRERQIGIDAFKDIARRSTHSILAACGLQHRASHAGSSSTITSVCSHNDQHLSHRESALMPGSCRECFYAFVMDVVKATMSEALGDASTGK